MTVTTYEPKFLYQELRIPKFEVEPLPHSQGGYIDYHKLMSKYQIRTVGARFIQAFDMWGPLTTYRPFETKRKRRRYLRKLLRNLKGPGWSGLGFTK